ncbi:MAG: hypothetical protein K8E24_005595 [Methanobacterium paludis]|nr:hypothetical protein [Methanobacterium paludis]
MVKCPECGFENPKENNYCLECGNKVTTDYSEPIKKMNSVWFLITILFPVVGIIGGIYYWKKGYKNAAELLLLSIFIAALYSLRL